MKNLKHLNSVFWSYISRLPMSGKFRWRILRIMGVTICPPPHLDKISIFIGENVVCDTVYPEEIVIHNHVHITAGCVILTHYLERHKCGHIRWKRGKVEIAEGAFIGMRTLITNPVTIGKNSIVGAGSVVTHDIPSGELWAGVPARFIKKLDIINN